ncbi:MAG: PDZ domain-containing protein [Acidimicrobiia bacterium]
MTPLFGDLYRPVFPKAEMNQTELEPKPDPTPLPVVGSAWTRGQRVVLALVMLIALTGLVGVSVRPAKVIFTPGTADPVNPIINITGAPTYRDDGRVLFLTVFQSSRRPTLFELAAAYLDADAEIENERDVFGTQTRKEANELDQVMMTTAQASAKAAALRRLGYTVTISGDGVRVLSVESSAPAALVLKPGDVITAVDGQGVSRVDQLSPLVRTRAPGAEINLSIKRGETAINVTTTTIANSNGEAVIGVTAATAGARFDFPVDITITSGEVSGPSAGLAFTLGIIDDMTPGDLVGGGKVAASGTITPDGVVGPVGGLQQKAVAAKRAGARLMLVPDSEVDEVRSSDVGIEVVGVKNLDDALRALAAAGGTPLPSS